MSVKCAQMGDKLQLLRVQSPVCSDDLAQHVWGSSERYARLTQVWKAVEEDPAFSKIGRGDKNHYERYTDACRKIKRYKEILDEVRLSRGKQQLTLDDMYDIYLGIDENLPIDVHLSMFIPLMMYHSGPDQRRRWLDDALNLKIIGAYAQTELAHGSNVRGIETEAVYDALSQTFELHSPTLTSLKWWPGGLGHTATHAVVYANLIIGKRNYGMHAFMVQLRDLQTHHIMPGIECGDIGPKLGYNSMDNGYARFTHVTLQREDMLSGFAQVAPDGTYTKQAGSEKIAYGIMLDVRCRIVSNSAYVLARALTIAIRYSFVRVQGGVPPRRGNKSNERAVIDYPSQRRILVPLLALAYGLHFTGVAMRELYTEYSTAVYGTAEGKSSSSSVMVSLLPRLHMESAGLKALVTSLVADGMEACRKACGGHGFLSNAGFADLLTSYLPFCTLEGTREVLGQQTGRSLLKLRKLERNKQKQRESIKRSGGGRWARQDIDVRALLSLIAAGRNQQARLMSPAQLVAFTKLLYRRVELCLDRAERNITEYIRSNSSVSTGLRASFFSDSSRAGDPLVAEATLAAGADLIVASEAFCEYLILRNFAEGISKLMVQTSGLHAPILSGSTIRALQWLWQLLFLTKVVEHSGDYCACAVFPEGEDGKMAMDNAINAVDLLCDNLRPDLVNLVEAWKISDTRLDSTLGRSDGKYVDALYDAALMEPLNASPVSEGYSRYLKEVVGDNPDRESLPFTSSKL